MTGQTILLPESERVVFADANVIYSRVLRDYLLYAAIMKLISVTWSRAVLDEVAKGLLANNPGFSEESVNRLIENMTAAFPYAEVNPEDRHFEQLSEYNLPDENDRHVFAAALASEAGIICTSNTKDFPGSIASELGIVVMSPDTLLSQLICENTERMIAVHDAVVSGYDKATSDSTISALMRAGAARAAGLLAKHCHID